jgi:hypothetical protein
MRNFAFAGVGALLLLLGVGRAEATVYVWKDPNGVLVAM